MPEQDFNAVFSKRLRYYLNKFEITQVELAKKLGVGTTSVYNWCNGIKSPRMDKVDAMCDLFHCNRSDLMEDKSTTSSELTARDEKDIAKILEQTKEQLLSQEGLMFDGDPASPEAINSILDAMQIGMEMAKKKNKEKYTPKKYKKD
nr:MULTISPECIES: helix-turn-helix transcriptional regulator [unclassified Clostridium]